MASVRCLVWIVVATLLTTLLPVSSDNFWWDQARGQAVWNGELQPSRFLLRQSNELESDWLAGVPGFLAYTIAGGSGLMLWKLGCSFAVAMRLVRLVPRATTVGPLCIVFLLLMALSDAWDDPSLIMDVLCVVSLRRLVARWNEQPRWTGMVGLILLYLVWPNVGERVLLGLFVLVVGLIPSLCNPAQQSRSHAVILLAACAAVANPRGLWVFRDSFVLTWPHLFESSLILGLAGWQPLIGTHPDPATISFIVLTLAGFTCLVLSSASRTEVSGFVAVTISAWVCTTNVPFAAAWITCTVIPLTQKISWTPFSSRMPLLMRQWLSGSCLIACVVFALVAGSGWWPGSPQRFGWGIHPRLEIRLCEDAIQGLEATGSVWCRDIRGAGMIAWLRPGVLQPQAVPKFALLQGQLRDQILLDEDLRNERRAWYRREDGSVGGWWIPLRESETLMLMVSGNDLELIGSLEPTIWKPLSLDSPVIPFGMAGDPLFNDRITEVLQQRDFVDSGPWSYSLPPVSGNDLFLDVWGMMTGQSDQSISLQQAGVFRAMNLRVAALRVLIPLLQNSRRYPQAEVEFSKCQFQLAHGEEQLLSLPSQWRQSTCRSVDRPEDVRSPQWEMEERPDPNRIAALLQQAAELYVLGQPQEAINLLVRHDPEVQYARACLLLETGRPSDCADVLIQLLQSFPDSPLSIVGQDVLSRLSL